MDETLDGWTPIRNGKPLGISEPTYIKRWGYEVDRSTVLDKLFSEATGHNPSAKRDDREKPHRIIAHRHPVFSDYWKVVPNLMTEALKLLPLRDAEKVVHANHREVVEAYVRNVVREQMVREQKRTLWKKSFLETLPPAAVNAESWRGPWEPIGKRVVKTGTYSPESGGPNDYGDSDYEPASLVDAKTHVLLLIRYAEHGLLLPGRNGLCGLFVIERAISYDWRCEKVARTLMEAK